MAERKMEGGDSIFAPPCRDAIFQSRGKAEGEDSVNSQNQR